MRRAFIGSLVGIALVAGNSAFAGDAAPSSFGPDSAHSENAQQVVKPRKHNAAVAPLSAAAAYEATRADLPATSIHSRTPVPTATERPWTGFYVGVNAGATK